MTGAQINSEIKATRVKMMSVKDCMKDKSISVVDRKVYYSAYISASSYLLQLEAMKPSHNLSIA